MLGPKQKADKAADVQTMAFHVCVFIEESGHIVYTGWLCNPAYIKGASKDVKKNVGRCKVDVGIVFFWCSYTWNDYETEAFPLVSSLVSGKEVFYMVKAKQANKNIQHTHLISGQKWEEINFGKLEL